MGRGPVVLSLKGQKLMDRTYRCRVPAADPEGGA
jgi:hypothetical protein